MSRVIVVLGVSGAGKTTVGRALASRLKCVFHDADDFHSPENRRKMSQAIALTDADRAPWLASLREQIEQDVAAGRDAVVACSALKAAYRQILRGPGVQMVYLKVSRDSLLRRLAERKGHYFNPALLDSQLATLEEPSAAEALPVDADRPVEEIVDRIIAGLGA